MTSDSRSAGSSTTSDDPDALPPDFAESVLGAVQPSGGWAAESSGGVATLHATTWALRCLLELRYPDLSDEAWVAGASPSARATG